MAEQTPPESHLIKIPKAEYETLLAARAELMRLGYQKLPAEVIERARIEGLAQGKNEGFTQGAIVTLGLAALLHLLSEEK